MVRQTGGRRTDNSSGTADRGGGARGGGAVGRGGGSGGVVRKAVFRPTVRAPPIGAPSTFSNSGGEPVSAESTRAGNSGRHGGGLLLVNRKPAAAAATANATASTAASTSSTAAALGSHYNSASQAKGEPKPVAANPWAVRSQRQEAAAAAKPSTRPTAAMLNGRRHPISLMPEAVGDDDYEGKENWDEMLDKGFDFSQDIEFGDGTAVRINPRARSKLPPSLPPTPTAVVESPPVVEVRPVQPTQPSNDAILDPSPPAIPDPSPPASTVLESPATHASPAAVELPPTTPRPVETSWGKPTKPSAAASAEGASAAASTRWWKASLSSNSAARPPQQQQQPPQTQAVGSRSNANPVSTPAPVRGSAPTRVETSDGNSSSNSGQAQRGGRGERGGRPGRGSRRSLAPIPTVVPPVLLRRPTQAPPAALNESCPGPEQVSADVAAIVEPPAPSTEKESKPKDNAGGSINPTLPVKGIATAPKPPQTQPVILAETGSSSPRNPKKTTEPGSRKPNGANSGTTEPSRLVDNWRAGTAPRPPAPQTTASTQVTAPSTTADGPVEAARVPANAARRRSTGAAKAAGNGSSAPGLGSRPAVQQDKPDRITNKASAAATATSWRADPNRAKPAADASNQAPVSEEPHDATGAGRQRAQTQGAAGGCHDLQSSRVTVSFSGPAASNQGQMNGLLQVAPQTTLPTSPPLLPQTMLADLLGEHESSAHGKQSVVSPTKPPAPIQGNSGAAVPASRSAEQNEASAMSQQHQSRLGYGGAAVMPISSSSLFNVEGSPLMGNNHSYNAPIRPAFGHTDPGLFTWQGSHMGFHDTRARQEYLLQANTAPEPNAPYAASREQPARWSNTGEFSQQPHGVGSGVTFSSFSAGAGMLWMDPMAYDSEGRSFPAPIESRPSSHGDNGSGSASGSGAGSSSGGARGYRAPGRTPRPIGTRSVPGNNTQRNTRSRQGGAHQSYGAPSPVPQNSQHPLFVPASHMHQSWLPHYSLMQPPYGATSDARFGRASPRHSPQMTAAPQATAGQGSAGGAPYMVPLTHAMDHQSMHQMPPGGRNGATTGPFANMPPPPAQYMPDSFRPSPPPPPMYQYGYMGGVPPQQQPPSTKPSKAGQVPATSMAPAPHYHHGYPPQLAMPPNHTGAPPHMAFMPMYIPSEHGAIGGNGNPGYYYGQQQQQPFGAAPPPPLLGQYRQQQQTQPMPGYPNAMHMAEAQGYLGYQGEQMATTKQAEKLLGISRSSSTSTRERGGHGSSKGTSALSESQQANINVAGAQTTTIPGTTGNGEAANMPRTASTSKSHNNAASGSAPQTKAGGDRTRQRGRGNERKTTPTKAENGEASCQPRQQQRPDAKRVQQPTAKTDDKARKQQPRPGNNSNGPCEDGKAPTGEPGPSEKPARRNRGGNRSGRGGAKKGTTQKS